MEKNNMEKNNNLDNLIKNSMDNVDKIFEVAKAYKPTGDVFPLGFREFDLAMDKGVRSGELVVISAETAHGKTSYAQQLTINFDKVKVPSLWFTYEMNPWYLKEKFVQMGAEKEMLGYTPMKIYGTHQLETIYCKIREAKERFACKIIFIDHLHYLIPLEDVKNSSLMIGGIVRELKKMAVEFDVVIFLIAHTKKIYQGEELDMSSIRDSGLISQEADYVFLLQRIKEKQDKEFGEVKNIYTNKTRITLAKNRRTGKCISLECEYKNNLFIPITYEYSGDISPNGEFSELNQPNG